MFTHCIYFLNDCTMFINCLNAVFTNEIYCFILIYCRLISRIIVPGITFIFKKIKFIDHNSIKYHEAIIIHIDTDNYIIQ